MSIIATEEEHVEKIAFSFHALHTQQKLLSAYSASVIMDERTHSQSSGCLQYKELKPHKEKILKPCDK